MGKIVQEKFQEEFMRVPEGVETGRWLFDKSARVEKGMRGKKEKIPHEGACYNKSENNTAFFNSLPPGMEIEDQEVTDIHHQNLSMSGHTDVSHDDPGPGTTSRGFHRKKMRPTDDLYTNEHVDMFYGEVKVEVEDGEMETGFLERGNMLDRM